MENEKITEMLGRAKAAWDKYLTAIRDAYEMDELWDGNELKFRRGGKTLVTLYIKEGFFTILVIYGKAERAKFEEQMETFPVVLQGLYRNSRTFHDGKWMFGDTADESLLPDVMRMLAIKRRPNQKAGTQKRAVQNSNLVEKFMSQIPDVYTGLFRALADHAISLGYRPVRCKTAVLNIDFRSSKAKRTIMKFSLEEEKHDGFGYGERNIPGLRMRFFAAEEYSETFRKAVQYVIERFDGKYTGCYGCGRCQGEPQGYHYTYPDGRKVFRCGGELLSIFDFTDTDLDEMKKLMDTQAQYDAENIIKQG